MQFVMLLVLMIANALRSDEPSSARDRTKGALVQPLPVGLLETAESTAGKPQKGMVELSAADFVKHMHVHHGEKMNITIDQTLGVIFLPREDGRAHVEMILPQYPLLQAGLLPGDVITKVEAMWSPGEPKDFGKVWKYGIWEERKDDFPTLKHFCQHWTFYAEHMFKVAQTGKAKELAAYRSAQKLKIYYERELEAVQADPDEPLLTHAVLLEAGSTIALSSEPRAPVFHKL